MYTQTYKWIEKAKTIVCKFRTSSYFIEIQKGDNLNEQTNATDIFLFFSDQNGNLIDELQYEIKW